MLPVIPFYFQLIARRLHTPVTHLLSPSQGLCNSTIISLLFLSKNINVPLPQLLSCTFHLQMENGACFYSEGKRG